MSELASPLLHEASLEQIIEELDRRHVAGVYAFVPPAQDSKYTSGPSSVKSFGDATTCLGLAHRARTFIDDYISEGDTLFLDDDDDDEGDPLP